METRKITTESIEGFASFLRQKERSDGTIEKYLHDVKIFCRWLDGREVTQELAAEWKQSLLESGRQPVTVNSMIAAINAYFRFAGWNELRLKSLRLQKRFFRETERELTEDEYRRLVRTARKMGNERIALLMETICATGIRVSELRHITAEAVRCGRAQISMKGKHRTILIPDKLCKKLRIYMRKLGIKVGEIFLSKNGSPLSRKQIWADMKALCRHTGVLGRKVFPHNLRHLFARSFYSLCRDIVCLADVMGHSSIETTRIYLISTEAEYVKKIARLQLVL